MYVFNHSSPSLLLYLHSTMAKKSANATSSSIHTESIEVFGAREHNLKNIDITVPKNKLVVFTGVSGSGKSSLAFDTIYNEGQRRYMESFGAYARQFMGDMERPDVDKITGLSPVISIEQKTTNKNPRSTVGTVTEVYDFLRLLYARIGEAYSYNTGKKMVKFTEEEIVASITEKYANKKIVLLAPLVRGRKGHYRELFEEVRKKGFLKVRIDGDIVDLTPKLQVDRYKIHDIELVVDRLQVTPDSKVRLSQSVQQTLKLGKELLFLMVHESNKVVQYAKQLMCEETGLSYEAPSPNAFSFNSPYGACSTCKGLGNVFSISLEQIIPDRSLSIKEGGIAPLGVQREAYLFKQVEVLAKKHKISIDKPISSLSEQSINLLLYGTPDGPSESTFDMDETTVVSAYEGVFEGVVPMLNRWFTGTGITEALREWVEQFMELKHCPSCEGARLKKESLWFKVAGKNIAEISDLNLDKLLNWFEGIENHLSKKDNAIAKDILKEIRERVGFLLDVGLTYLSLSRPSKTLSGGESQRIRLATQIGSQLQGITYILDEPSIGLHQRDNMQLIKALQNLRDIGNSIFSGGAR